MHSWQYTSLSSECPRNRTIPNGLTPEISHDGGVSHENDFSISIDDRFDASVGKRA